MTGHKEQRASLGQDSSSCSTLCPGLRALLSGQAVGWWRARSQGNTLPRARTEVASRRSLNSSPSRTRSSAVYEADLAAWIGRVHRRAGTRSSIRSHTALSQRVVRRC